MKKFRNALLFFGLAMAGCKKINFIHFESYDFSQCGVNAFWTHYTCPNCSKWDTLFSITYNKFTGYPQFIHCSFLTVAAPKGPYYFHVAYLRSKVILSDDSKNNPYLTVWLNHAHRPDSALVYDRDPLAQSTDRDVSRYRFQYSNGRLSTVLKSDFYSQSNFFVLYNITYDQYGNVTRMASDPNSGFDYSIDYTYNYAVADKQQFYLEELEDNLRGFVLMRYLGMFNELQPHHERILVDETDNGYRDYYGNPLIIHDYNSKGQLIRYGTSEDYFWNVRWGCENNINH